MLTLVVYGNGRLTPPAAYAVVGNAEEYNRFEWENLTDFQSKLVREEQGMGDKKPNDMIDEMLQLEEKKASTQTEDQKEEIQKELSQLRAQLLHIPKPKRFGFEASGQYQYISNNTRATPGHDKCDDTYTIDSTFRVDLSGRKTDLRFELNGGKLWSIHFPLNDMYRVETRLRYRRKYFKRVQHSANLRIARTNNKAVELNSNRVRWDAELQQSVNWAFSRKLSINLDNDYQRRMYLQQAFSKDSGWQFTTSPSAFWNFTPKSRISVGGNMGVSRNLRKENDANSYNANAGYFGKITKKSSASLNFAYSRQVPQKQDSTTNTYTIGVGYAWQMTGKSQLAVQAIRQLQNTVSTLVSGGVDNGTGQTIRTTTWFTNDSISLTLNSRLTRKINVVATSNWSWTRTHMSQEQKTAADAAGTNPETYQMTFPQSVNITYLVARWMTLTAGYQFEFRDGSKHKTDQYHNNTWTAAARLVV